MLTVNEALASILSRISPLPPVILPLLDSLGCVLAEDIVADIDNPPFDNSAVDGYAVRSEDVAGASPASPVILRVNGDVTAGNAPGAMICAGSCARVMTGAPIPAGADSMVMVEDSRALETPDSVAILSTTTPGDHVRRAGEDVRLGDAVLRAGITIRSAEIAMLAAMGRASVKCVQKPRVSVISTGDELVDITRKPAPGQIRDSNRYTLAALVAESGAELHSSIHIPDDAEATERAFRSCARLNSLDAAHVIVTSGGVSVGDRDFVKPVLEKLGTLELWRVRMKPGKPLAFGRIGETLFFGLPGNPVSTIVTFELFVSPALRKLAGHSELQRPRVQATLECAVSHVTGRDEFVRARLALRDGKYFANPTGAQGSGVLTSMLGANSLLVLPSESRDFPAGAQVKALILHAPIGDENATHAG